jgi:hypothetical protein
MSNTTDRDLLELAAKAMGLRVISFAGDLYAKAGADEIEMAIRARIAQ